MNARHISAIMLLCILVLFTNINCMINHEGVVIRENTQANILHYRIGVANIWERDLPDDQGRIKSQMSATVAIFNTQTEESREEKVRVGSLITLDAGHQYRVLKIDEGDGEIGSITIQLLSKVKN